jgi:hypothetical protein
MTVFTFESILPAANFVGGESLEATGYMIIDGDSCVNDLLFGISGTVAVTKMVNPSHTVTFRQIFHTKRTIPMYYLCFLYKLCQ